MPAYPVNVSAEFVKEYKVTAAPVDNGTVTANPTAAVEGTVVTVTVKAKEGYKLTADSLKATYTDADNNNQPITLKDGTDANTYTFTMPAGDVAITAAFEAIKVETYSVTTNSSDYGKVTANKTTDVKAGETVTLTVEPVDNNSMLTKLAENGLTIKDSKDTVVSYKAGEKANTYTFTMPDDNVTVTAQFTIVEYGITTNVTPTEGGTIKVTVKDSTESIVRAAAGTMIVATFTAADGYQLSEARCMQGAGGGPITAQLDKNGAYGVTMPANRVDFEATFEKKETTEPTNPSEGDNTNNGGEETQSLEAEERTVHGAAEKTTITAMAVFTCTDKNCASAQFVDATVKQTSGVTTAAVNFNGKDYTAKYGEKNGWVEENGKKYWYENGVKQGTEGRGKEIYDPDSDAWYWLDAVQGGAMTVNKDVYQESAAGQWADKPDGTGKWVRYDENGHMIKGWQTTEKGTYYFDPTFGTMAKGVTEIDGVPCAFDQNTGIGLDKQWVTINGADYWYENGVRQGLEGRGKEIYDPASDAWYWLDSVDQGKKATSKDVYQESEAGQWADRPDGTGKWVRYDAQGHMIKGWSADKRYYFDPIYGTMAKGDAVIDGRTYHFDKNTGIRQ